MVKRLTLLYLLSIALTPVSWVQAEPVALIENISGQNGKFQIMDFLDPGIKIQLKPDGLLVLGYLNSCIQESIRGGSVTVGKLESIIVDGQVERKQLTCEGTTKALVTRTKKRDAGAVVFRNKKNSKKVETEHEVYGLSPLIYLTVVSDEILLTRMGSEEERYKLAVTNGMVDLAQKGIKLHRNSNYLLEAGTRTRTFKVSAKARRKVPLLSRLLRF